MAESQGSSPSRWGGPEPERPTPGEPAWKTSRWGQPEGGQPAPPDSEPINVAKAPPTGAQRQDNAETQEPIQLKAAPAAPSEPFPLPSQQINKATGRARQQRSYVWLKTLEGTTGKHTSTRLAARSRRRLVASGLLAGLCVLLAAAVLTVSVPGLRERALGLLPPRVFSQSTNTTQAALIARSNVPNSLLDFNGHLYHLAEKTQALWSVQVPVPSPGTYSLTISAPHYIAASGTLQLQAQQQRVVTAFLTTDPAYLASLLSSGQNQISGQPLASTVAAGAQYTGASTAAVPLKVTIGYRVVSLVSPPAASVLEIDESSPPATAFSGVVTPDILFSDASSGATISEYAPNALPAAHFLAALTMSIDASGQAHFGLDTPSALTATTTSGTALVVPGGVTPDLALLFALVQTALEQGKTGGGFTCIGLVDAVAHPGTQPDPEDGLLLGVSGSRAHYFYRWGQFWTTNSFAHTLTPALPQANEKTLELAQSLIDAGTQGKPTGCA